MGQMGVGGGAKMMREEVGKKDNNTNEILME